MFTMAAPGVVPINGKSTLTNLETSDPTYINGDLDIDSNVPLVTGEGTYYQMPTTASGHRARAWKTRGWKTVRVIGSASLVRINGDTLDEELMAPLSFSGVVTMDIPPAYSMANWTRLYTSQEMPPKDFGQFVHPYGANLNGNVDTNASAAGYTLDWQTPCAGTFVEVTRDVVPVNAAFPQVYAFFIDDVPQVPAVPVTMVMIVKAQIYGNSSVLKNGNGEFFSLVRVQLSAEWECITRGATGLAYQNSNIDELNFYFPTTLVADSILVTPSEGYEPNFASGVAVFRDAQDVRYNDVQLFTTYPRLLGTPKEYFSPGTLVTIEEPYFWSAPD